MQSFLDNYRELAFWLLNIEIGILLIIFVASFFGAFSRRRDRPEINEYLADGNTETRFRRAVDE